VWLYRIGSLRRLLREPQGHPAHGLSLLCSRACAAETRSAHPRSLLQDHRAWSHLLRATPARTKSSSAALSACCTPSGPVYHRRRSCAARRTRAALLLPRPPFRCAAAPFELAAPYSPSLPPRGPWSARTRPPPCPPRIVRSAA
jgi:hypothetical protein